MSKFEKSTKEQDNYILIPQSKIFSTSTNWDKSA